MQLRRITTSGSWIPEIDGLRFMAIVSVVFFHLFGQISVRSGHVVAMQPRYDLLYRMLMNGDRGVELFFVISGYILARPFLRQHRLEGKPVRLRQYFLRRVTRLEPPYIVSLLLFTLGLVLYSHETLRSILPHLAASAFYLHNLTYHVMSTVNFVTWSLEIEIQFYLLAPLLGQVYRIRNTVLLRTVLIAMIVVGGIFNAYAHGVVQFTVLFYMEYFFTGFLLAELLDFKPKMTIHRWWDAVSVIVWPMIFLLPRTNTATSWLPGLILPVYLAAFYGPVSRWFFRRPFVALTGGMCYSIYLTHMLSISIFFKATRHLIVFQDFLLNYVAQVLTLGVAVLLFGGLYFVLLERPCMDPDWPRKIWARVRGRRVVETAA